MREKRDRKEREALRQSFRGECYDAQGNWIGNIHQIETNQYKIYDVNDGRILAMSIKTYKGNDFEAIRTRNYGYSKINEYKIKEAS